MAPKLKRMTVEEMDRLKYLLDYQEYVLRARYEGATVKFTVKKQVELNQLTMKLYDSINEKTKETD